VALRRLISFALLCLALAGCAAPRRAQAQFIGYVSPQTVQQSIATNLACTGSAQTFTVQNIGQEQHYLSIGAVVNATQFQATLQGVDTQGNLYTISDAMEVKSGNVGNLHGSGYFPKIQVVITCLPAVTASFTASYSGGWGVFDVVAGSYLTAQIDKVDFFAAAENANQSDQVQTPYGSSAGTVYVLTSAGGNGGKISVSCGASTFNAAAGPVIFSGAIANSTALQVFQVPDTSCPTAQVSYTNNGTGGTVTAEYVFAPPGSFRPAFQYTHVTGTTATAVKATLGYLHTVSVNTGAAGTISIFDLASASCTGTPATNTVAVITATTTTLQTFTYDTNFLNGICVKASVAMDFTVSSQ
jgi:hypothetical protein